jgi:hypothetical protein
LSLCVWCNRTMNFFHVIHWKTSLSWKFYYETLCVYMYIMKLLNTPAVVEVHNILYIYVYETYSINFLTYVSYYRAYMGNHYSSGRWSISCNSAIVAVRKWLCTKPSTTKYTQSICITHKIYNKLWKWCSEPCIYVTKQFNGCSAR